MAALRCAAPSTLSGSKNAALPIMMASLLTDEPLMIQQRAAVARCAHRDGSAGQPRRRGALDRRSSTSNCTPPTSPRTRRRMNWSRRCARRSSCLGRCWRASGARASPLRADARSVRGRSTCISPGSARSARDPVASRLRRGARRAADGRAHLARFAVGRRDREYHDGGGAGARRNRRSKTPRASPRCRTSRDC